MRNLVLGIFFILALMILTGSLGLVTDPGTTCNVNSPAYPSVQSDPAEQVDCYQTAALTAAYLQDSGTAASDCAMIWNIGATTYSDPNNDGRRIDASLANTCYYNIAKVLADPSICSDINDPNGDQSSGLDSIDVLQANCVNETTAIASIQPQNYWTVNNGENADNSICTIVYIIPFVIFFSIKK